MGIVFDIQRFSVHDGPGIRTAVFLKGCNMRCLWCHNPESFLVQPQLSYDEKSCILCGACQPVCPYEVHEITEEAHTVDFSKCTACGRCVRECFANSLKIYGKELTAQAVVSQVIRDRPYYNTSGGGITLTGGEPTVQFSFLIELLKLCAAEHIHICLETNGAVPIQRLEQIVPYVDLFLLDYKATGEKPHQQLTGQPYQMVRKTMDYLSVMQKPVILRCPMIPGLNDSEEHFSMINLLTDKHRNIESVEIMPYHSLGKHKWNGIGMDYSLGEIPDASKQQKEQWQSTVTKIR